MSNPPEKIYLASDAKDFGWWSTRKLADNIEYTLSKAEATIAEMKETHQRVVEIQMKELSDLLERNEALDALTKQQRAELTALRSKREEELREAHDWGWIHHNVHSRLHDEDAQEDNWNAFLQSRNKLPEVM